jgi:hypothetical protein
MQAKTTLSPSLSCESLGKAIQSSNPQTTHLVAICPNLADNHVDLLTKKFPRLEELCISTAKLSDTGLQKLGSLSSLQQVEACFCPNISPQGAQKLAKECESLRSFVGGCGVEVVDHKSSAV